MFFKYGNYSHEAGEVAATALTKAAVYDSAGNLLGYSHTWQLKGRIHAASASALTAAIQAMEAAYAVQGQDAGFWLDAATPSAHYMRSADMVGGVKVTKPPSYGDDAPGQYTTYRDYTIELSATTAPPEGSGGGGTATQWNETVTFYGGGPVYTWLVCRDAPPQRQLTTMQTTWRASQSGEAVSSMGSYPMPPAPRWPSYCHTERTEIIYHAVRMVGKLPQYRTTWKYEFEADVPLG